MKKKILAMVLSLAMCCSMTACGSANKDTATSGGASSDKKAASKNDNGSDLAYIQDKGTLIVIRRVLMSGSVLMRIWRMHLQRASALRLSS